MRHQVVDSSGLADAAGLLTVSVIANASHLQLLISECHTDRSSDLVQSDEKDFKAWYDVMARLDHVFDLDLDLSDLERRSDELISTWDVKIERMAMAMPQLGIKDYMEKVSRDFSEKSFVPLSDVWKEGLDRLLGDL